MRTPTLCSLALLIVFGCDEAASPAADAADMHLQPIEDALVADATPPTDAAPADSSVPDAGPVDAGAPAWVADIQWRGCFDVAAGARCADIEVPADWADPGGSTIEVRVIRVSRPGARGQLWMLAGGPGQSARGFAGGAAFFARFMPERDLYLLDFRGTGASTHLGCPGDIYEPAGTAGCVERLQETVGEALPHFTVTAAARDLGELIAATRAPDEEVLIYAGSFGTYWAHRYLQLYPEQPTAVILDGLCPPGTCDYSVFQDPAANEVARDFFGLCAEDPECAARLGEDPWAFVGQLHATLATGEHCPDLPAGNAELRDYIMMALLNTSARAVLPAVLYRFARCTPDDVAAIDRYNSLVFGGQGGPDGGWSDALRVHVIASEILPDPPPTVAEMEQIHAELYAAGGESIALAELAGTWPRYPRDAWVDAAADTEVPVLMLNGTLDPATSPAVARGFAEIFDGPNQHLVMIDYVSHGVLLDDCAQALITAFADQPTSALDTACATDRPAPDLSPDAATARMWLGVDDAWGE